MIEVENAYESEKKSVVTRLAVLLFIVTTLLVMPTWAVLAALDGGYREASRDAHLLPVFLWGLWGGFSSWIIFDTRRFLRIFSESFVPMGPEEVTLTLAGIANLVVLAICLAVVRF